MKWFDLPPVWAAATACSAWVLAGLVPVARFGIAYLPAALAGAGVALILWSALFFRRHRTPIEPRHRPTSLIRGGPYRLNRNPIYTGMALVLLGFALWLGALSGLLPVLAFPFVITKRFILGEEVLLREAFGEEAEAFLKSTRRW